MKSDWDEVELGELLECVIDHRGRTPKKLGGDFSADGVPVISARNIKNSRLNLEDDLRYVEPEMWHRWMPTKLCQGDVLLTSEAPLGEAAYLFNAPDVCLGQRLFALRANQRKLDGRYLFYALQGPTLRHRILARASGTTAQGIRQAELVQIPIPLPPLNEQRRIASVLGVLDDKVESNRRIIAMLDQIAGTLFKARFVDFLDQDDLVESEIGFVPRDWPVGELRDVAKITMGHSPPSRTYSKDPLEGPALVQGKGAFGRRFPNALIYCNDPKRTALKDDLLLTVRAPVGEINVCTRETCLGRGVAGIASSTPGFVELSLRCGESRWRAREGGTIYPSVNKRQVEEFPLVLPPKNILNDFETTVHPVRSAIAARHEESGTLARLMETLLPRLVSGKIRISPAEAATAMS